MIPSLSSKFRRCLFLMVLLVINPNSASANGGWLERIMGKGKLDGGESYNSPSFNQVRGLDEDDNSSPPHNDVSTPPSSRPHVPYAGFLALPKAPLMTLFGGWFLLSLVKELRLLIQEVADSGLADLDGNGLPPAVGAKKRRHGLPQSDLDDVESFMKVR